MINTSNISIGTSNQDHQAPTPLAVAIDASFVGTAGGIGTYSWKLIESLMRLEDEVRLSWIQNLLPNHIPQYADQHALAAQRIYFPPQQKHITHVKNRALWTLWTLPRTLRALHPQVYHAVDSVSIPFWRSGCGTIVTVHDIIPLTHPQYCRARDVWGARVLMSNAVRRADAIITVSHDSAERIRNRFPAVAEKVRVIYSGVDHQRYTPCSDRIIESLSIQSRFGLKSPFYLLTVVTLNPRRNLERLLLAFDRVCERSKEKIDLVIAGCKGWKDHSIYRTLQSIQNTERVHFLGMVSDDELVQLYRGALAFAFPSLLEGFGLPVLEAMACGLPVVCSSTSSLGEIAGDAAITVDPENLDELTEALWRVLTQDSLRQELLQKGILHARRFQWSETAQQTLEVYKQVAG